VSAASGRDARSQRTRGANICEQDQFEKDRQEFEARGWCPPDSGVYNEPQAEKAWSRLLALYGKALA
jgi:hypothetical protein